jgi:CRISPR type I-D-associated protein Csc3/Cas10d
LEDEIGRKEMWTRGVMLAGLLAEALPVRVVLSESPLVNFEPAAITSSLTLINPPEVITNVIARVRLHLSKRSRYKAGDNDVSRAELRELLKVLIFALRVNKTLGGVAIAKDGREYNKRPSRRIVEIVQALADELLVGAWLHQRDWQSRPNEYRPSWFNEDYRIFTQACLEVDKMLNPEKVDRLRNLAQITQTFYAPPVYDSSHALTLPFKVAIKTLQKFIGTKVTEDELKTIMRSDIESAVRRQADVEGSRAWIVLKRAKKRRQPDALPVAVQLTEGVRAFAFVDDIVHGICGDTTNFLMLRKRLQSGYLIQMKDLALATWEQEGWRMFKSAPERETSKNDDDFSVPA